MPEIITINPDHPDQQEVDRAVKILKEGGVIAYPTETFYGLGVDAENPQAVARVFTIKGRPTGKPIALVAGGEEDLNPLVTEVSTAAHTLMKACWPGPLTLVMPAAAGVNPRLTAGTGKLGIRVSSHPVAAALAKTLGRPITATSANTSGKEECSTAAQVRKQLGMELDAIVDGGRTRGGSGSTILDMTVDPPVILRAGAIPADRICAILLHRLRQV